jgi:putative restriction endonuclease
VPFLSYMKGIHRARAQRGPAALAVLTSHKTPYHDEETEEGFLYDYRAGPLEQADNLALRAAHLLQVPIVYFRGTRPGWYHAEYPCFIERDDVIARRVLITPGRMVGHVEEPEPEPIRDPIEKRYAVKETKVRLHQASFRGRVLPAYLEQCAVCRLKEIRLLDAAHIPQVANGLSLCSIHHRSFDQDLVGISPDYEVHVSQRLLDDEDGPMLNVLKGFQGSSLLVPRRKELRTDRDLLAMRFERFTTAA